MVLFPKTDPAIARQIAELIDLKTSELYVSPTIGDGRVEYELALGRKATVAAVFADSDPTIAQVWACLGSNPESLKREVLYQVKDMIEVYASCSKPVAELDKGIFKNLLSLIGRQVQPSNWVAGAAAYLSLVFRDPTQATPVMCADRRKKVLSLSNSKWNLLFQGYQNILQTWSDLDVERLSPLGTMCVHDSPNTVFLLKDISAIEERPQLKGTVYIHTSPKDWATYKPYLRKTGTLRRLSDGSLLGKL